jgi:hypothetical protein
MFLFNSSIIMLWWFCIAQANAQFCSLTIEIVVGMLAVARLVSGHDFSRAEQTSVCVNDTRTKTPCCRRACPRDDPRSGESKDLRAGPGVGPERIKEVGLPATYPQPATYLQPEMTNVYAPGCRVAGGCGFFEFVVSGEILISLIAVC